MLEVCRNQIQPFPFAASQKHCNRLPISQLLLSPSNTVCKIIPDVSRVKSQPLTVDQSTIKRLHQVQDSTATLTVSLELLVLKLKCTPGPYKQTHFLWKTLPTNLCAAWKSMFSLVSSLLTAGISLLQCQRPVAWKLEVERLRLCLQKPTKEGHDAHAGKKKKITEV